jgi:endonuclease-3 related protein
MDRLPADLDLYQDYHAQIVKLGSGICKKQKPRCAECPIRFCCQMTDQN